jgi:hypothetical protein
MAVVAIIIAKRGNTIFFILKFIYAGKLKQDKLKKNENFITDAAKCIFFILSLPDFDTLNPFHRGDFINLKHVN